MADEIVKAETAGISHVNGFADGITEQVNEQGFFATFSTADMAGRRKLYNATQNAKLLRDFMGTPITISDVVFAPSTVTDEEGFSQTVAGVYLIGTDGTAYLSTSQGVCKSAMTLLSQLGMPDTWGDEPVTVICQETNTARGRRYKSLALV